MGPVRVAMLVPPGVPFGDDWARAATTVADVVMVAVDRPRLRPDRPLAPVADRLGERRLLRAIESLGPVDVLHSHYYPNARLLPAVSRRLGIPYVHTEHSTRLTGASPHPAKQLTRPSWRMAATVFAGAARVLVVSEYLRRCLVEGGFPGQFEVVGNPLELERFRVRPRRAPDRRLRFVSVGRLEVDKGFDVLLRAMANVGRRRPDVEIEVIGGGPDRAALEAEAGRMGVGGAVRFLGWVPRSEIAGRLAEADAFACSSRVETFGVAVAEALASGRPVVTTAAGGLPELVGEAEGLIVPVDDADALADAMLTIGDHLDRYEPEAVAAGVRSRFSDDAIGARLAGVYEAARNGYRSA